MAGFSTPTQNVRASSQQQPKQMSSRLLNMKFMQRAAASSATSTPASSAAQMPATEPLAKRRRIDSTTSSPSASTPGTPSNGLAHSGLATPTVPQNARSGVAPRGGISTFTRFEGADTEWVLDLKIKFPGDNAVKPPSDNDANVKNQGFNMSEARFGVLNRLAEEEGEDGDDAEGEDIWNNDQPSGRQTFGSFDRRQKSRTSNQQDHGQDENDQDLSSASNSDSDSDEDSESDIPNSSNKSTSRQRGGPTQSAMEVDSDEEMHRVRMAIEQKHRSMKGAGHLARTVSNSGKFHVLPSQAGDWRCSVAGCSFHNFESNIYCMRCGTPRTGAEAVHGSAGASPTGSAPAHGGEKRGNKRKSGQGSHKAANKKKNKKARKTM